MLVSMLNSIGIDYDTKFSIITRTVISSANLSEFEISIFFENKTLKNKRILVFKSDKCDDYTIEKMSDLVAESLLRYLMFSIDNFGCADINGNPIEVFSAKTIFNRIRQ